MRSSLRYSVIDAFPSLYSIAFSPSITLLSPDPVSQLANPFVSNRSTVSTRTFLTFSQSLTSTLFSTYHHLITHPIQILDILSISTTVASPSTSLFTLSEMIFTLCVALTYAALKICIDVIVASEIILLIIRIMAVVFGFSISNNILSFCSLSTGATH